MRSQHGELCHLEARQQISNFCVILVGPKNISNVTVGFF